MQELYEFRLYAKHASDVCGPKTLPTSVHAPGVVVRGKVGDDLYRRVEELTARSESAPYAGWTIRREYTPAEIDKAELFLLRLLYVHAAGDEYGTEYTEPSPSPACGVGRVTVEVVLNPFRTFLQTVPDLKCALGSHQIGPLRLPAKKMLKTRDIFMLWSGETVVSDRLSEALASGTGGTLQAIRSARGRHRSISALRSVPSGMDLVSRAKQTGIRLNTEAFWLWCRQDSQLPIFEKSMWERMALDHSQGLFRQLVVHSRPLTVSQQSIFGNSPFVPATEYCQCVSGSGEVRGLNLLSPLYVARSSWDGSDICRTDVSVGGRRGLFRPHRLLLISQRIYRAMQEAGVRGVGFEVVELT